MDIDLMNTIRKTRETEPTESLKKMYLEHDESKYAQEIFVAIHQILIERGESVPDLPVEQKSANKSDNRGLATFRWKVANRRPPIEPPRITSLEDRRPVRQEMEQFFRISWTRLLLYYLWMEVLFPFYYVGTDYGVLTAVLVALLRQWQL